MNEPTHGVCGVSGPSPERDDTELLQGYLDRREALPPKYLIIRRWNELRFDFDTSPLFGYDARELKPTLAEGMDAFIVAPSERLSRWIADGINRRRESPAIQAQ
jgi:hypothetical protein